MGFVGTVSVVVYSDMEHVLRGVCRLWVFFFFFQAEDGIRDLTVTGVQTCALPISIALAFLVAFFNQLSGINAILYFAPRIFALTGLGEQAALLRSVGIGVTNLILDRKSVV